MSDPHDDAWRRALAPLRTEEDLEGLEDRVAAALAADRGGRRPPARQWLGWAAALVLAAGGGFLAGQGTGRPPGPAPANESYLLLLHAPPPGTPIAPEADVVAELRAWAGELDRGGHLLGAEKLRDDGWRLAGAAVAPLPAAGAAERAGGYFLLRAASAAEALRLAAACPLLRHGGRLELRPVDPT